MTTLAIASIIGGALGGIVGWAVGRVFGKYIVKLGRNTPPGFSDEV